MGDRIGKNHVRLADGTVWSVDRVEDDEQSLEWVLRYGRLEDIAKHRMTIASIVGSYHALLCKPQKRRNAIVSEIWQTLDASDSPGPATK